MPSPALKRLGKIALYVFGRVPHGILALIDRYISGRTFERHLHPKERFPWSAEVEALYPAIREEVERMIAHKTHLPKVHEILPMTHLRFEERDWRQVTFLSYGHWIEDHCALYPNVARAFRLVPNLQLGTLSVLKPGETIPMHAHIYKGFLIFHLGVIIPETGDCAIRIAGETARWENGKVLVIDPTYPHEVWNNTDVWRVIVLGEFSRPDLPPALHVLDRLYCAVFNLSPAGRRWLRTIRETAARHRAEMESDRLASPAGLPGAG
jgi:beta-hydroxylase